MCLNCGCGRPDDTHSDSRHITLVDLRSAAEAAGVSVAEAAANISKTVAVCCKATVSDSAATGLVIKADPAKRFLLTVAWPACRDTYVGADGYRDVASEDVVERAAWNFMRKGARVGMWHEPGHGDAAQVVENYIWRSDPWVTKAADGTEQVIMPGDWLVGLVLSESSWSLYKAQAIGGVSMQGGARRQRVSPETLAQMRSRVHV